jgi:flavodoxin
MKTLVVYFSKTGNTRKIAEEISKKLNSDLDEITEIKTRGFFGKWINGARESISGKSSKITYKKNPKNYDLIILGGPIWAWHLIPPIRAYLEQNKKNIKKLAFFVTFAGSEGSSFDDVKKYKEITASMMITDKKIKNGNYKKELNAFCSKLKH